MNAVIDYKGYPDDTLTISLNRQNVNVFTYYYDDFITLQYDKRSGGLVNINIEGITLAYRDVENKALISLDRDENGNLIGFEIVNVTKLMSGLLESSER